MCLRLIIAENRSELFSIWSEVFSKIQEVVILNMDFETLRRRPELDAILIRGMFAHERYGGTPKIGESQILSTKEELNMPPWVVTTAPFAAHIKKWRQPDYSLRYEIVQNEKLAPEEEDYIVFSKAFERVEQFNKQGEEPRIQTLGFELEFLYFPRGEPRKEAEVVRKAYLEHNRSILTTILSQFS